MIATTEIEYLDFRILQWQNTLPAAFVFAQSDWSRPDASQNTNSAHLFRKVVLALRANQLRTVTYKPILHTTERILVHENYVNTAIQVAGQSIQLLTELSNHDTDLFLKNALLFKYFLVSAFSILILAVANSPGIASAHRNAIPGQSSNLVSDEFSLAINLFRQLAPRSTVMSNLWQSVQSLQLLVHQTGDSTIPHSANAGEQQGYPSSQPQLMQSNATLYPQAEPSVNQQGGTVTSQQYAETLPHETQARSERVHQSQLADQYLGTGDTFEPNAQLMNELSCLFEGGVGSAWAGMYDPTLNSLSIDNNFLAI